MGSPLRAEGPPTPPAPSKLAQACSDSILASVDRESQLDQKLVDLWKQVSALSSGPGSDSKKPLKDWMTPAQLDQFNMLTAQMRYVQFSIYGEVMKRRKERALLSLIKADEKDDEFYAADIAAGNLMGDAANMNADIEIKMTAAGLALWNSEMTTLNNMQFVTDAQTVKIDADFLPRLSIAKTVGPRAVTDDLGFLFTDNVKDTVAYRMFDARLDDEIKKGNPSAVEIKKVLAEGK